MNIILNQQAADLNTLLVGTPTVAALLHALQQDKAGVAVAQNDTIVSRSQWASTLIDAGDRIDIFSVIAGG
ncbi:sulfur carrier protein ThiS [uncultured Ferrimonas sp.]|uniref:sulfur carrier protein ThiS n=1 Tax=uncultured Ferrimonas sp. TaxID=432640 RepID=UPI0026032E36|nr:sulfur carrier protein ThiS [uncultured Ferrimonas sp.]